MAENFKNKKIVVESQENRNYNIQKKKQTRATVHVNMFP